MYIGKPLLQTYVHSYYTYTISYLLVKGDGTEKHNLKGHRVG